MSKPTQKMFVDEGEEKVEQTEKVETEVHDEIEEAPKAPKSNIIKLPSNGVHGYPTHVEYRDITVGDEEKLASAEPDNFSAVLNGVIKSVLNDCEFYEQMSINDREYLIVWLWANNYNAIKEMPVVCSNHKCEKQHNHKVDLTKLDTTDAKERLRKPFTIQLSKVNAQIGVRCKTVADELAVEKLDSQLKDQKIDMLRAQMISALDIGFHLPLLKKIEWVRENVTGREFGYVRKFHDFFHYGVERTIEYKCPSCGEVTKGAIPFSLQDIFYPESVQSDFEELL